MPRPPGDGQRALRWLWTSHAAGARLARGLLVPLSGLWAATMVTRAALYRRRLLRARVLPRPCVAIGNLSVGGSGKTPLAAWVADYFASRGVRPGILLRGVGHDETLLHEELVPDAVVVAGADRIVSASRAIASGARVLVLDDAYQRLDVARDLNVCLVSAESSQAASWSLPAGPWREGLGALNRADVVVVTRKRADAATAAALAEMLRQRTDRPVAVVHLALSVLHGLVSGDTHAVDALDGRRVVAASAIADPEAFGAQLKRLGARVQVAAWTDHHQFRDEDLAWLAHAARRADVVVITAKDAVKLRRRWPASVPEPWVAALTVTFEAGAVEFRAALDRVVEA
jgi:tetraacyldisaccharide 4'-kinase